MLKKLFFVLCILSTNIHTFHNIDANVLKKYLPEDPVILEAGAYKGVETIEFTCVWPRSTIYAFEPAQSVFAELKATVSTYRNIKIYNEALAAQVGFSNFYLSYPDARNDKGCDQSSSLLEPKLHLKYSTNVLFREPVLVPTITLDVWAQREGIDHIDFLWFDLQGVEYDVLKASPNILKTVRAIFTEVNYVEAYKGNVLYNEYKQWLLEQGFVEVHHKPVCAAFGDALFVRKELV